MPFGIIEMASLDALPSNLSSARTLSTTVKTTGLRSRPPRLIPAGSSSSTAAASGEVSTKTIITVSVVLGVFLVGSVVGAVVTFVQTEAKDASRSHNHSGPTVEYIRFALNDTLENQTLDAAHELVVAHEASTTSPSPTGRNATSSFGSLLEALAGGGMAGAAAQRV